MVRILKSKSGFTLVELLVVVAIVGVLATAGIPQYRRMVQKSKKAEAQVYLGSMGEAEQAFFSEYQGYGNNLSVMGVEVEGNASPQRIYAAGFTLATCAGTAVTAPTLASVAGININSRMPGYYPVAPVNQVFGRTQRVGNCLAGVPPVVGNLWITYTVAATGSLRSGVDMNAGAANDDQWTINETRTLVNIQNGTD